MFKWLRKLTGRESGKYIATPARDPRTSEIIVNLPPSHHFSSHRTERPAPARTVQPRQQMNRAASSPSTRRRDDTTSTTDNSLFIFHQPVHDGGSRAETPAPTPSFKSDGGGEFGGGGASGGWGGSDGGSCGGGDGGGGCGGGGDCHADFAHDVTVAKLNRRARDRTLFIQ